MPISTRLNIDNKLPAWEAFMPMSMHLNTDNKLPAWEAFMPIYECYLLENSAGDNLHEMSKLIFLVNKIKKIQNEDC